MKAAIRKAWVKDLRDPKNKQATGQLRKGDAYCCLGRLCVLYNREHGTRFKADGTHLGNGALPNFRVLQWAGLILYDATELANMNDLDNATFDDISYVVENL